MERMYKDIGKMSLPKSLIPKRVCDEADCETVASIMDDMCKLTMDFVQECKECHHRSTVDQSNFVLCIGLPSIPTRSNTAMIESSKQKYTKVSPKSVDLQWAVDHFFKPVDAPKKSALTLSARKREPPNQKMK